MITDVDTIESNGQVDIDIDLNWIDTIDGHRQIDVEIGLDRCEYCVPWI